MVFYCSFRCQLRESLQSKAFTCRLHNRNKRGIRSCHSNCHDRLLAYLNRCLGLGMDPTMTSTAAMPLSLACCSIVVSCSNALNKAFTEFLAFREPWVLIPMELMPARDAMSPNRALARMPPPDARGYMRSLHLPNLVSTGWRMVKRSYRGMNVTLLRARRDAFRMAATSSAAFPVPCPNAPCSVTIDVVQS